MKRILILIMAAALLLTGCGFNEKGSDEQLTAGEDSFSFSVLGTKEGGEKPFRRFVWISYLDLSSVITADEKEFEDAVGEMITNLCELNITDVFLQVRAFGDAIYKSEYFIGANSTVYGDWSDDIDYLGIFAERFHEKGIRVHAWINPYRLSTSQSDGNVRFIDGLKEKDALSVIEYGDGVSLNPANDTAKALIIDGVKELMEGYEIDGIHLDDYFYPTTDTAFDETSYGNFTESGGMMSLEDFRRDNVSRLVSSLYETVKSFGEEKEFGISPDANIGRDYGTHYANVELWCTTEGYIDYICPQIYFGFNNQHMPFKETLSEWAAICKSCDLIAGLSFYKAGSEDIYAGSGSGEWTQNMDIISRQYDEASQCEACKGIALYRYDSLFNPAEETAAYAGIELYNLKKVI